MNVKEQETKIIFCGLPSSGKTTFLGALSYLAESNEVDKDLELIGLPNNRHFFNELADQWVCCEPMLRTKVSSSDKIEMTLRKDEHTYSIEMPDLSGETWQELWTEHELDKKLIDFLNAATCVIFFIHTDNLVAPMSISDEATITEHDNTSITEQSSPEEWKPSEHAPTQAIVVDILRKVSSNLSNKNKRLALVLSAWDTITTSISPKKFIKKELPLLHQYLNCKFDYEQIEIFGVSAQGGDLENDEKKEQLLSEDEPSKRIKVTQDGSTYSEDLTKILSWLINE